MNYRGWMFIGFSNEYPKGNGDGRGANPKHRPIRSYPVSENRGLAFAYFDYAGVEAQWEPPRFLDDEKFPDVVWQHRRMLELHHPSVPLDNSVDPRHFEYTHSMFGKHIEDGEFKLKGHKAVGTMATRITPPLSFFSGTRAAVTTYFDSPLNTYLRADVGFTSSDLCNFLTIIKGKKCLLTQVGIGRRSMSPFNLAARAVGFLGSWFATYEDAAVWNNRKPQEPDNDPHQTDKALADFREWFEGFAYPPQPAQTESVVSLGC